LNQNMSKLKTGNNSHPGSSREESG
jgi:hypothetical protein